MRLFLIALLSLTLVTGCSWTKDLLVKTEPIERIPLVLPDVDRYHSNPIEWIIITEKNSKDVFAALKKKGQPIAIIGMTGDDYELLALNTSNQQVLIKQLNAIIKAYKTYYIAVEERDKDAVVVEE